MLSIQLNLFWIWNPLDGNYQDDGWEEDSEASS